MTEAKSGLSAQQERAAKAEGNVVLAEQHAAEANAKAEGFRLAIAEANRQAAEANKKAEEERFARIKIEERIAGWKLDANSQQNLADRLEPFSGTPYDLVTDPSESGFMNEIDKVLINSGWIRLPARQADGQLYSVIIGGKAGAYVGIPGINIEVTRDSFDHFGKAFSALTEGLVAVGIPAKTNIVRRGEGDSRAIHIVVGKME